MGEEKILPKDWKTVISSAIMDVRDGTHDTPKYVTENGIPLITSKNLKENKIDFEKVSFISKEDHSEISKRSKVEEGDILFAMIGTIGNPAVIKGDANFSIKNVGLFKKNESVILPEFFVNFLRSSFFEKQLNERKLLKGTTQKFIPLGNLRNINIPLPPLKTQQLIVSKIEELFSELDKGIENLKTAQQQLKIYRQAVLKWAFEGKLLPSSPALLPKEKGVLPSPPAPLPKERGASPAFPSPDGRGTKGEGKEAELPKGWKLVELKEICEKVEAVKRKEKNPEAELLYLDIGGIDNNTNKIVNHKIYKWKNAPSRAQQIVFVNDILFSTVRTYMKNIAVVENKDFDGQIASSGFCVIRGNKKLVNPKFIFQYSLSEKFLRPLNELQTGTSYPAVRDKDVFSQLIPLPSIEEQNLIIQEIESRLSVADKMEESISQSLQQAEALRQSILKKAFEGKLV